MTAPGRAFDILKIKLNLSSLYHKMCTCHIFSLSMCSMTQKHAKEAILGKSRYVFSKECKYCSYVAFTDTFQGSTQVAHDTIRHLILYL